MGRTRRSPWWWLYTGVPIVLIVGVLVTMIVTLTPQIGGGPGGRGGVRDNARSILLFMIDRRTGEGGGGWPAYSGKNFVLSVVATKDLDIRRRENLEILFGEGGIPDDIDIRDYEAINRDSLKHQRFSPLTHFAGRRNADPRYRITEQEEQMGTPLIAIRHRDGVIVGYSGGDVRFHDREELGLDDDEPIVFGDSSRSDLLRCLSDE